MIPISDINHAKRVPFITMALIAACIAIYLFVQPTVPEPGTSSAERQLEDIEYTLGHAAIPCEITKGRHLTTDEVVRTYTSDEPDATESCLTAPSGDDVAPEKNIYLAVLYSVFMHGGLFHLGFNMLFLWVFGNNIEDRFGVVRFTIFYLLAGIFSTAAHIVAQPTSTLPVVGASGAIAGVMGAYLVLFPTARIRALFFVILIPLPAWLFLGYWFISQFYVNPNSGIAWVAHVSGFVFGVAVAAFYRVTSSKRTAPETNAAYY